MQTYTIFAGVNGAGKTSIYKSIYYNENKNEKRINTDEMVALIGSWKDNNLQMKSAREAVKLIKSYILEKISFNQETTLTGKSIIKNIKMAKGNGFYIVMNYIGVESPEIAKDRVNNSH
jgi:predicted ABC-type ATPase